MITVWFKNKTKYDNLFFLQKDIHKTVVLACSQDFGASWNVRNTNHIYHNYMYLMIYLNSEFSAEWKSKSCDNVR